MTALVPGIEVMEVADLYAEYGRLANAYSPEDNPLHRLTQIIPARSRYYTIVPLNRIMVAGQMMKRLAGRRKLHQVRVEKDEIRHPVFAPTREVMIFYA